MRATLVSPLMSSPVELSHLLALKHAFPLARIIVGNSEIGVETKFKGARFPVMIAGTHVAELRELRHDADGTLVVGASVTLAALQAFLKGLVASMKKEEVGPPSLCADAQHRRGSLLPCWRTCTGLLGLRSAPWPASVAAWPRRRPSATSTRSGWPPAALWSWPRKKVQSHSSCPPFLT